MPPDFEMVALLREARQVLPRRVDPLRAELAAALGSSLYFSDRSEEVLDCVREARSIADALGNDKLDAIATETEMLSHWRPSALADFLTCAGALETKGRMINDPLTVFRALIMQQSVALSFGDIQEADVLLDKAIDVAQQTPHPLLAWQGTLLRSCRAQLRGDFIRSEELSSLASEMGQRVHPESAVHLRLMQHFQVARFSGDLEGWDSAISAAIEAFPSVPGYRAAAALTYATLGQPALSRTSLCYLEPFRASPPPPNCLSLLYYSMLAETAVILGDLEWSKAMQSLLTPYAQQMIVAGWGVVVDGSAAHYVARLAETLGDHTMALEYYQHALQANRALAASPLVARSLLHFGVFLGGPGRELQSAFTAADLLHEALAIYSAFKFPRMVAMAQSALDDLEASNDSTYNLRTPAPLATNVNIFRREGDYWSVCFNNVLVRIRHSLGMQYIANLIAANGNEVHVLDLIASDNADRQTLGALASATADPILDPLARSQYRQRLIEIEEDLELAQACNDAGRAEMLHQEKQSIVRELAASYGLSGRQRTAPATLERARIRAKNRLTSALNAIKKNNPAAWRHFDAALRTGRTCSYRPEHATRWVL